MSKISSFIAISDDFMATLEELKQEFRSTRFVEFIKDSFLLEDAKNVVSEAYICEVDPKVLFIGTKSFNIYAQNSLLKILEEPPTNIYFIICVNSKSMLLPTIRSRLPIRILSQNATLPKSGLDIKKLKIQTIYEFMQENRYLESNELLDLVQAIIFESFEAGFKFSQNELETFSKLIHLISLNSKANAIFPTLFSILLSKVIDEV